MSWKTALAVLAAVAAVAIAVVLVVGGDDSDDAEQTDGAFITEMVPHHESAVEMAEVALERAQHPEVEDLARQIIDSQSDEIEQLGQIHKSMFGESVEQGEHGTLGLPAHEAGMEADMSMLENARPFDQAFIDMMIPHHQGAIRMARISDRPGRGRRADGNRRGDHRGAVQRDRAHEPVARRLVRGALSRRRNATRGGGRNALARGDGPLTRGRINKKTGQGGSPGRSAGEALATEARAASGAASAVAGEKELAIKSWHVLLCVGLVAAAAILIATGAEALAVIPVIGCAVMGGMMWIMMSGGGRGGGDRG